MSEQPRRNPARRAYTDETIVMPRRPSAPQPPRPSGSPRRPQPRPRAVPRRRIWPTVRNAILAIAALALVLLVVGYLQIRSVASAISVADVRSPALTLGGGTNLLIIGTDERVGYPGEGVRGDTLIVAHYDTLGRWVNLLSIPRDTQVDLADVGTTKINVAYGQGYARAAALYRPDTSPQQGGMALAAQTVESLLKLPDRGQHVNYIATINFDGFARIIDALGGVTIDVPRAIHDDEYPTPDFGVMTVDFQPGVQHMDGEQALIYARTRHDSSDFDRGARQQQVMRAIVDEAKRKGPIGLMLAMPKLREGLRGAITTTMPIDRPDMLLGLLWLASGLNPDEIGQARLSPEIDPGYQELGSNLVWSDVGIRAATDALLTRPAPAAEQATVQVFNGTEVSGLAVKVSGELENQGYTVVPAGNAPTTDNERTIVYDVTGKPGTARQFARLLNAQVRQGAPEGITTEADIVVLLGKDAVK